MVCAFTAVLLLGLALAGPEGRQRLLTPERTPVPVSSAISEVAPEDGRFPGLAPVALSAEAIGLHSSHVVELGLTDQKRLEAPEPWEAVGWYALGEAPGETGAAVLAGHLDSDTGPAVFHRLKQLEVGDTVSVARADGAVAHFAVYAVEQYAKEEFPTHRVYGDTQEPELRLITCGGDFDDVGHSYEDNVVVYARITEAPGNAG